MTKLRPLTEVPFDAPRPWCASAVEASVEQSLRALRSDTVAAVLVHRSEDWSKGRHAVRDVLRDLRNAGVCQAIGASVRTPAELVALLDDEACGYVQLPFNVLDSRWLDDAVQSALAARADVTVAARSVFLQGLLVAGESARWPSNAAVDGPALVRTIATLAGELGRVSSSDLCLAYVLAQPWVHSAVVGADNVHQLLQSAELARRTPLTADEVSVVSSRLGGQPVELLDPSLWRS